MEVYSKKNHKNELTRGKRYNILLTYGNEHIIVKNDQGMHEHYHSSWFQPLPLQIDSREYFDRMHVDEELVNKIESKEKILKFL